MTKGKVATSIKLKNLPLKYDVNPLYLLIIACFPSNYNSCKKNNSTFFLQYPYTSQSNNTMAKKCANCSNGCTATIHDKLVTEKYQTTAHIRSVGRRVVRKGATGEANAEVAY